MFPCRPCGVPGSVLASPCCDMTNRPSLYQRGLLSQAETEVDERPQDGPPTDNRLHFCLAQVLGRIDFRHWNFHSAVAEPDGAQIQVGFEFVLPQPIL